RRGRLDPGPAPPLSGEAPGAPARPVAALAGPRRLRLPRGLLPLAARRRAPAGAPQAPRLRAPGVRSRAGTQPVVRRRRRRAAHPAHDRRLSARPPARSVERRRARLRLRGRARQSGSRGAAAGVGSPRVSARPGRRLRRQGARAGRQSGRAHRARRAGDLRRQRRRRGRGDRRGRPRPARRRRRRARLRGLAAAHPGPLPRGEPAMNELSGFLQRNAARLVALALIGALYGFARLPTLPESERQTLASRFAFARLPLAAPPGDLTRSVRKVHPDYKDIAAWISSVGAAVALNDLDGDGLANDLCTVDPRVDKALVEPVPGTGARYPLFALDPAPLPYDARTTAPMGCLPGDWNEDGRM